MNIRDHIARWFAVGSKIVPKENKIVLYSTGEYSSNLLSLLLRLDTMQDELGLNVRWIESNLTIVNILREKGFDVIPSRDRRRTLQELITAKWLVSSHGVPLVKSSSQISIELWHGIPLKSIGKFNPLDDQKKLKRRSQLVDYFVTSSHFSSIIFSSVFGVAPQKFRVLGSPALDSLIYPRAESITDALGEVSPDVSWIGMYLPTYRDYNREETRLLLYEILTSKEFKQFLTREDGILILKVHPWDEGYVSDLVSGCSRILLITNEELWRNLFTVYDLLSHVDVLITDYSSVYFDYLLLNRPIVFYAPDLEEYRRTRGFLLEPYERWTPGDKARNVSELMRALDEALNNPDKWKKMVIQDTGDKLKIPSNAGGH